MQITGKNILAFLMTSAPTAGVSVAVAMLAPRPLYVITLVMVFLFHLSGAWLQAIQPSIRAKAGVAVQS